MWLTDQRTMQRNKTLDPDLEAILDSSLPGWNEDGFASRPSSQAWFERLSAIASEVSQTGKWPASKGKDAVWIMDQRTRDRRSTLREDQIEALDAQLPGWRTARMSPVVKPEATPAPRVPLPDFGLQNPRAFQTRVEEITAFYLEHRRLPIEHAIDRPDENTMAVWLSAQRQSLKNGTIAPDRKQALDDLFPGWSDVRRLKWAQTLDEVASFRQTHGKLPGDSKTTPRERALQVWVKRQRVKELEGKLAADQVAGLDKVDPDWRANQVQLNWESMLTMASLLRSKTGTLPAHGTPEGAWMRGVAQRHRAGLLPESEAKEMDKHLPGWNDTRYAAWRERADGIEARIRSNGRTPSHRSPDPQLQSDAVWIRDQKARMKKGSLTETQEAELKTLLDIPNQL
ncbi:helicase associated domain-containing protein [Arthrobacter sp. IK3]|uniref:helicase associated domain-containing protein n=1 Tax=Arthrobacter sp. IK3 TaxID=3448169 RepID=UPI003EDF049D